MNLKRFFNKKAAYLTLVVVGSLYLTFGYITNPSELSTFKMVLLSTVIVYAAAWVLE